MKCPMTMNGRSFAYECEKDNCAWWCAWANCCAMLIISREMYNAKHSCGVGGGGYAKDY